jgi:hypothetical protein
MAKTMKHSTSPKKSAIKSYKEEYHTDFFSFRLIPVHIDYIKKFAHELVEWAANDETARTLGKFYRLKRIRNCTVDKWADRCPELKEAIELATEMIGDRREDLALIKQLDAGIVTRTMGLYNAKWQAYQRSEQQWLASINASRHGDLGMVTVEIPALEFTDVPPAKVNLLPGQ